MKRLLLLIAISALFSSLLFGQEATDSIFIKKMYSNYHFYYQDSITLKMKELVEIMEIDDEAYEQIRCANTLSNISVALGITGTVLVVYPLGEAFARREPHWVVSGVGVAMLASLIPLRKLTYKKTFKAIDIYNSHIPHHSSADKKELYLGLTTQGIGVTLNF